MFYSTTFTMNLNSFSVSTSNAAAAAAVIDDRMNLESRVFN